MPSESSLGPIHPYPRPRSAPSSKYSESGPTRNKGGGGEHTSLWVHMKEIFFHIEFHLTFSLSLDRSWIRSDSVQHRKKITDRLGPTSDPNPSIHPLVMTIPIVNRCQNSRFIIKLVAPKRVWVWQTPDIQTPKRHILTFGATTKRLHHSGFRSGRGICEPAPSRRACKPSLSWRASAICLAKTKHGNAMKYKSSSAK